MTEMTTATESVLVAAAGPGRERARRQDRAVHPRRRHRPAPGLSLSASFGVASNAEPTVRVGDTGHPALQHHHRRRPRADPPDTTPTPTPATAARFPCASTERSQHMLRSLFSSISGMRANQTMMDVVGNNIANVNTIGYKSSLRDVRGHPQPDAAGRLGARRTASAARNPAQIGLGVRLAGITTSFTQGAAETTGRSTDLMLQGDGFFVVNKGGADVYTRNGSFGFDAAGNLVNVDGGLVQGWTAPQRQRRHQGPAEQDHPAPRDDGARRSQTTTAQLTGNLPVRRRRRLGPHGQARRVRRPGQRALARRDVHEGRCHALERLARRRRQRAGHGHAGLHRHADRHAGRRA